MLLANEEEVEKKKDELQTGNNINSMYNTHGLISLIYQKLIQNNNMKKTTWQKSIQRPGQAVWRKEIKMTIKCVKRTTLDPIPILRIKIKSDEL